MISEFENPIGHILIIDGDFDVSNIIKNQLESQGHSVYILNEPVNYFSVIEKYSIDTIILDIMMPDLEGFDVLKQITHRFPQVPVIIYSALEAAHPAVTAMKLGAFDYIVKSEKETDFEKLQLEVRNAVSISHSMRELNHLRTEASTRYRSNTIIGASPAMQDIFEQIEKVANSNISVVIYGESGTGKELVARAIHNHSDRSEGPFADLNCAAVPENLIESELFGHEKGAFTGAYTRKIGKFEQANGGTLFLDEIGDMPLMIQAKILRAIQERSFERVGGLTKVSVDVRILSATNKDLKHEVEAQTFRNDLYYRLTGFPIHIPPLRERVEDIPSLVNHFVKRYAKDMNKPLTEPTPEALAALKAYAWPGNVRELENIIQRAVVLADKQAKKLHLDFLPLEIQNMCPRSNDLEEVEVLSSISIGSERMLSFEEVEKRVIQEALNRTNGNVSLAAEQLKIGRATMYRKIDKYDLKIKK
ncbi:sigma-54-dependent Fis family transcriptional regulator [candidate division KSB1 bacterium]|nr:sigma-54-dependent Fis family transcriptional regulator [candidate division KSB1 bacterium]